MMGLVPMGLKLEFDPQNVFYRCVEDCSEAIMLSKRDGSLVYVNPAWQRIYGYTAEEAIGKSPRLLHSGHQADDFYRKMWAQISDPEIGRWKGELINRAKDGTLVPVLLTITPIRDLEGAVLGYMGIAVDQSGKRELEAKIVHQDRLASIGMLASGLAHEVGTPLGVIRGRAEFLAMKAEDSSIKNGLGIIVSQIDRISKLIRSLLRVSRSFSDVRIEEVPLRTVVDEVLGLVGQNLKEISATITVEVDEGMKAMADYSRLEQILLNLVMNSIHAIQKAISEGRTSRHQVTIHAEVRKAKIALCVTDTGCGISPENMKKLFKPFFTTKQVGEGTGLGLAIVAQLIHEIQGEISVKSSLGEGTTFEVILNHASAATAS